MRILAFAASNSSVSINQQLAAYAASLAEGAEIEMLEIHDYEMPIYRHDREEESGIPQQAHDFLAKVGSADALIISFAEHNGIYTAAFKNLFDWCSRVGRDVWRDKPMVLLSTSPGGRGGKGVLEFATGHMPRFGGNLVGYLSVPSFGENFDTGAHKLIDDTLNTQLRGLIAMLANSVTEQ
ncbi:NADPH-dependent FMN reductase [Erythrobacter crassostreae]|uniref:NAD(P)H-dependent oxidoreductase n=1 Tax=Erythrobacter crassostreae TaxID=2828328 RepID=A0A9X1F368_9SPHN|nr:NAD(P)H-dependent oxidoreductase [Erythrobacter crassostrea]MBV7257990.1 NAD(P)H-dependent oxidoreductase [Erythrobacter crassostrea]